MEAVEKMHIFYQSMDIDYLKETISILGIARKFLFKDTKAYFSLFGQEDKDLYYTIKKNIVGGPSIIFTCYHQVGETLVRGKKVCQNIVGYDCNVVYLWGIGEEMPTGYFMRRDAPHFKPKVNSKYLHMFAWMDRVSVEQEVHIAHKLNAGK